jgi:ferritin
MMDKKMEDAINDQIVAEIYSAYLYLSMSADFEAKNLKGHGNWMRCQAQEEVSHAMRFYNYMVDKGVRVKLGPIEGPKSEWDSPLEAFEDAYKHEVYVTSRINDMVKLAMELGDFATLQMLQWFVEEQVEEEASTSEVADRLKLAGDAPGALFLIDNELATRVFVPPPAEGK